MKKRLPPRIISVLMIIVGIQMYRTGTDGRYNLEVSPAFSIVFSLVGLVIFIYTFCADDKQFTKKKLLVDTEKMICERCREKYKTQYVQIPVCPKCDGKLVAYKGGPGSEFKGT